ncbi:hypothetical protein F4814DRAFT_5267 [Daldinia grandis]|nr:hypothetical protein F4814DRAFT_5267 [Daldinia grandis]
MSTITETPSPIPVALLGEYEITTTTFSEAILPDFKVIHLSSTPDTALKSLPNILRGQAPPIYHHPEDKDKAKAKPETTTSTTTATTTITTTNDNIPKAIVIAGLIFDDAFVASAQQLLAANDLHVPFFRHKYGSNNNNNNDDDDDDDGGVDAVVGAFADVKELAARAVKVLKKAVEEGKLDGKDDGVYFY